MNDDAVTTLLLGYLAAAGVLFLVVMLVFRFLRAAVRGGMSSAIKTTRPLAQRQACIDRPGKFKIIGVDRASKLDTTWHVAAESEANARAKAELEGIIVTDVERDPPVSSFS